MIKRSLLALSTLMLGIGPVSALASPHDLYCLTDDLLGSDAARQTYIETTAEAANTFDIAPAILVAIKRTESGRSLNPMVLNRNSNGTVDRGFHQVNTEVWLPELRRLGLGMSESDLHGVRANALIAAWIYKRQLNRHGDPLEAVGYYHKGGGTSERADRIRQIYKDKFMAHLKKMVERCSSSASQLDLANR